VVEVRKGIHKKERELENKSKKLRGKEEPGGLLPFGSRDKNDSKKGSGKLRRGSRPQSKEGIEVGRFGMMSTEKLCSSA